MYKKLFTLFIAALFICNISIAKILRVGYPGPQVTGVDYLDANSAVAAASLNDTIQIYAGVGASVNPLNKKLVFIGVGYYLDKNIGLQVVTTSSSLGIYMDSGGNGSTFEGLVINTGIENNPWINVNQMGIQNIIFKRCKINYAQFYLNNSGDSIRNITFSQCYFATQNPINFTASYNTKIIGIYFQNCIFDASSSTYLSAYNGGIISNISFENCNGNGSTANGDLTASAYYRNCIFRNEPSGTNNDLFDYCTFETNYSSHFVTGTSNQFGKLLNDVFSGDVSSGIQWDATWVLKSGSPAIGYGRDFRNNPIDAGAYGSVNPYKLSGVPPIPAFYKLTAPSTTVSSNPYTITFSVRANN